ncbi:MAG: alpha/beta hydrolase family protein [Opitutaceae bacterium]|nr:alpha/beta hydrolase family protein [Opitutaceae bacterium]
MDTNTPSDDAGGEKKPITRRRALGLLGGALALPLTDATAAAAGNPTPTDPSATTTAPDLPNFHPMMEWLAREHSPRMSFLDTRWSSLEEWKQAARPVVRERLNYHPAAVPLAADLVRREEREDFTVEVIRIHATPAYQIPARVLVPKRRTGRLPAVLALHCHSGRYVWGHEKVLSSPGESAAVTEFRQGTYGRPWAESLVRRGYIVIAIDAFYFGERRLRVEELDRTRVFSEVRDAFNIARSATPGSPEWIAATNRVCSFYEHHTAKTITATGATWPGIHVWDEMRTVDYLLSRADVDGARIGCIGLSGGGFRTAMAIASDPRIKAAVVAGWMTAFAHQLRNHIRHTWMVFVPGLYSALDLPDAAALHAPGALLVQQCLQDRLYPLSGMQAAVDKLTRIYAKAGIPERFRGAFHDVPHSFRPEMQEEAFDWMDRWL